MTSLAVKNIVVCCPSPFLLEFDLVSISAVAAFPLKELFKALGLEVLMRSNIFVAAERTASWLFCSCVNTATKLVLIEIEAV